MRVGSNPAKADASVVKPYGTHRVIIPVYIPHQNDYFQNALEILRLSFESLHLTAAQQTAVTVVSNGSCAEVVRELYAMHERGWIHQLVLDVGNRGKVNAILGVARASHEPFITCADADIFYLMGWEKSVETLFRTFPECGFVSPLGMPKPNCRLSSATVVGAWLQRELRFEQVVDLQTIERHALGVGHPELLEMNRLGQLVVRRGETTACVGCGHMIFTMRREVLAHLPREPVFKFDKAEENWIDKPNDVAGFWRLCPTQFTARHLGNTLEPWAQTEIESLRTASHNAMSNDENSTSSTRSSAFELKSLPLKRHWSAFLPWKLRRDWARRIRHRAVAVPVRKHFDKLP